MSWITYDSRLVEEAVFLAERAGFDTPGLHGEREQVYAVADEDERERRFTALYRHWFVRLELGRIVEQALAEQPAIARAAAGCLVVFAAHAKQESAELFVDHQPQSEIRRTVTILVRPASLLNPATLIGFLRHELFHISDMLDPAFAYEPALPPSEGGPTYDALISKRYQVLWDTAINGRMVTRGWLPVSARNQQLAEFTVTFPMLQEATERVFDVLFSTERHDHAEFVALAQNPRAALVSALTSVQPGSRCPLCRCPSYSFEPDPESLNGVIVAQIVADFPQWHPAAGLCVQCADLYRARGVSMTAARQLPGWREESPGG